MDVQFCDNNARLNITRLYYEGTDSLLPGYLLCYNNDTTDNVSGWSKSSSAIGSTTAEGYQNEGKYLRVEKPSTANLLFFAGVVANGITGPGWVDVYEPNGAQMPVYTAANCTLGSTVLGLKNNSYLACRDYTVPCIVANETVDRSNTNGLVLSLVSSPLASVSAINGSFFPTRGLSTGDAFGVRVYGDNFFTETGTSSRGWLVYITGDKETAGGNDVAHLRISGTNYAENAESCNIRGLNCTIKCGNGGICGELDNTLGVATKSGATVATLIGLKIDNEHMSADTPDEIGGLDVALCREGGAATTEYGMQLRTRGTINSAIDTAIRVSKDATDHGFVNLFNIETDAVDVIAASGDITFSSSDKLIPIVFNGSTYYLVATDNV
jgi:hypothetical protein